MRPRYRNSTLAILTTLVILVVAVVHAPAATVLAGPETDTLLNLNEHRVSIENGRLGSRFHLMQRVQDTAKTGTLGITFESGSNAVTGLRVGAQSGVLPTVPTGFPLASLANPTLRLGLTYNEISGSTAGVSLTLRTVTPFQSSTSLSDESAKLSLAPFIYQIVRVTNSTGAAASASVLMAFDGALSVGQVGGYDVLYYQDYTSGLAPAGTRALAIPHSDSVRFEASDNIYSRFAAGTAFANTVTPGKPGGFQMLFNLAAGQTIETILIYAAYNGEPVITDQRYGTEPNLKFYYTQIFANMASVINYAAADISGKLATTALFENNLSSSSLPGQTKWSIAQAFHSYLGSTWLLYDPVRAAIHFYTLEGARDGTAYLSTIDVAHEYGVFEGYEMPWALRMELSAWTQRIGSDEYGIYILHDCGTYLRVTAGQSYPNLMQVEENANFINLLYWYWRRTGDDAFVGAQMPLVRQLIQSIINRDGDGNGLADRGNNGVTFDFDTKSPLELGDENVYLGAKAMAAAATAVRMFNHFNDAAGAALANGYVNLMRDTLSATFTWMNGYLPCSLRRTNDGWNDPQIAFVDGFLYLALTGDMPEQVWQIRQQLSDAYKYAYQMSTGPGGVALAHWWGVTWLSKMSVYDLVSQKMLTWASDSKAYEFRNLTNTTNAFSDAWGAYDAAEIPLLVNYSRGISSWALLENVPPAGTPTPTFTVTPTPSSTPLAQGVGVLQGSVQLQGRGVAPTPAWQVPLSVKLYTPGNPAPAYVFDTVTDSSGSFTVPKTGTPAIYPGTYDVKVKNPQMLQRSIAGVAFADSTPVARSFSVLRAGDANNDNRVNAIDFSMLSQSYFRATGEPGFNAGADFNGDGRVNAIDFSLLSMNYFRTGDAALTHAEQAGGAGSTPDATLRGPATLALYPPAVTLAPGQTAEVYVVLTYLCSSAANVTSADIYFTYPSANVTVESITGYNNSGGKIWTLLGSEWFDSQGWGRLGVGTFDPAGYCIQAGGGSRPDTIAAIKFRAKTTTGSGAVAFDRTSSHGGTTLVILADNTEASPLTTQNGTITVSNPPTPTRTPTVCNGCPTPTPVTLAVDSGNTTASYTDGQGLAWRPDQLYTWGGWGYIDGSTYSSGNAIAGTNDPLLYQTERHTLTGYKFDTAPGVYSVTLKFAELYYTAAGKRIFDVAIEGQTVLPNLDIVQAAGAPNKAIDYSFPISVTDGQLNINFTTKVGSPKVNAIRIVSMAGSQPTPTATLPPATATHTATVSPTPTVTSTSTRTPTPTATPRDPYEPNNSFDQATPIQSGTDYLPYIDYSSDVDYYSFAVSQAGSLIWAALTDLPDDYDLFLYRPDRSLAAWAGYGGTASEYILDHPVGQTTGVYYLMVVGHDHVFKPAMPYRLRLEIHHSTPTPSPTPSPTRTATATSSPVPDPYEPNDSPAHAFAITPGVAYRGSISSADDVDHFTFNVPVTGSQITAMLTDLPADYDLYLGDAQGNAIDWSRYGGRANEYIFHYAFPSAGTYHVWVAGYDHAFAASSSYRLVVYVTNQ